VSIPDLDVLGAASIVGAPEVLSFVGVLLVSMLAIVAAYHAMQRPRLVLHEVAPAQWRARRRDFWQYVVSMLVLLPLWTAGLQIILLYTNNGLTGQEISTISMSIVLAVRVLAHVSREHAHELAKSIPLTIVTLLIVTSSGWRTGSAFDSTLHDWLNTQLSGPASIIVLVGEFVIAAVWYWLGVRWWYPRGHDVPGLPVHDPHVVLSHPIADRITFGSSADLAAASPAPAAAVAASERLDTGTEPHALPAGPASAPVPSVSNPAPELVEAGSDEPREPVEAAPDEPGRA
jgi:hypothetical protein